MSFPPKYRQIGPPSARGGAPIRAKYIGVNANYSDGGGGGASNYGNLKTDRIVIHLLSITGFVVMLLLWIGFIIGLAYMYPPISWAYETIMLPQYLSIGYTWAISFILTSGRAYFTDVRMRKRLAGWAFILYIIAFLGNVVDAVYVWWFWFTCVSSVASLDALLTEACNDQQWSTWIQAVVILCFLVHSIIGIVFFAKAWIEARLNAGNSAESDNNGDSDADSDDEEDTNGGSATANGAAYYKSNNAQKPSPSFGNGPVASRIALPKGPVSRIVPNLKRDFGPRGNNIFAGIPSYSIPKGVTSPHH